MASCPLIVLHELNQRAESSRVGMSHNGRLKTCVSSSGVDENSSYKYSKMPYCNELSSCCTNFRGLFCTNNIRLEAKLKLLSFHLQMSDFVGCSETHSVPESWEIFKAQVHYPCEGFFSHRGGDAKGVGIIAKLDFLEKLRRPMS